MNKSTFLLVAAICMIAFVFIFNKAVNLLSLIPVESRGDNEDFVTVENSSMEVKNEHREIGFRRNNKEEIE